MYNMLDDWDTLESAEPDGTLDTHTPTAEQIKQLLERKQIEEADNALTRELFCIPATDTERTYQQDNIPITSTVKQTSITPTNKIECALKQNKCNKQSLNGNRHRQNGGKL